MRKPVRKSNPIKAGTYTAIVTPMTANGSVDEESLKNLIEYQVAGGVTGIIPCGTTGESATLTTEEHLRVVEITIQTVAGRVPVIAGAGANSTREAVELTGAVQRLGADAVLSVVPYYNRPSQEGIYEHYKTIAERNPHMPIILYNVPGRTGIDMSPGTVCCLANIPNVIGIKEAKDDIARMQKIINTRPDNFLVFSGNDSLALSGVLAGADGVVSVASNVIPDEMTTIIDFGLDDCDAAGKYLESKFISLMDAMFCYPSPAPAKKALKEMGIIASDNLRLPMTQMDEASWEILREAMTGAGLLN